VPADQVRGDAVQPREDAVARRDHVHATTPRVEEGRGHEIFRGCSVAGPTKAKVIDGQRVPIEEVTEGG